MISMESPCFQWICSLGQNISFILNLTLVNYDVDFEQFLADVQRARSPKQRKLLTQIIVTIAKIFVAYQCVSSPAKIVRARYYTEKFEDVVMCG